MPNATTHDTLENGLGAVTDCLDAASAQALLGLRAPAELQARTEFLAERNTEGRLSEEERDEYETLLRVENFIAILQARGRRQLKGSNAA